MIAWAAMHRFEAGDFDSYDVSTRPKWRIDDYTGKVLARMQWVSPVALCLPSVIRNDADELVCS